MSRVSPRSAMASARRLAVAARVSFNRAGAGSPNHKTSSGIETRHRDRQQAHEDRQQPKSPRRGRRPAHELIERGDDVAFIDGGRAGERSHESSASDRQRVWCACALLVLRTASAAQRKCRDARQEVAWGRGLAGVV